MPDYYDELETRSAQAREAALLEALPGQIAHAKRHAPAYRALLEGVDAGSIDSRAALADLPVTRKSELIERQADAPPFGGFADDTAPSDALVAANVVRVPPDGRAAPSSVRVSVLMGSWIAWPRGSGGLVSPRSASRAPAAMRSCACTRATSRLATRIPCW